MTIIWILIPCFAAGTVFIFVQLYGPQTMSQLEGAPEIATIVSLIEKDQWK